MADTIQYITQYGERWDTISFKMYGTTNEVPGIIEANSNVPITERLPEGLVLEIPILDTNNVAVDSSLLPPWKQ